MTISKFSIYTNIFICKKREFFDDMLAWLLAAIPWYFTENLCNESKFSILFILLFKKINWISKYCNLLIQKQKLKFVREISHFFSLKNSKWWFSNILRLMATILWFVNILYDCLISCIIIALRLRIWLH